MKFYISSNFSQSNFNTAFSLIKKGGGCKQGPLNFKYYRIFILLKKGGDFPSHRKHLSSSIFYYRPSLK